MKTNQPTGRQNCQITPFNFFVAQNYYKDWSVRFMLIDDEPWFVVSIVCNVLTIKHTRAVVKRIPKTEKRLQKIPTAGGWQEVVLVNECGLLRIVLGSLKPEVENFRLWVTNSLLPEIHCEYLTRRKEHSFIKLLYNYFKTLSNKQKKVFLCDKPGYVLGFFAKEAQDE